MRSQSGRNDRDRRRTGEEQEKKRGMKGGRQILEFCPREAQLV